MGNSSLVGGNLPTHYIDNNGQLQPLPPPDNIRDILDPVALQFGQAFDENTDVSDDMIAVHDGRQVRYYTIDTIGSILGLGRSRWFHPETRIPFTEAQIVTLKIVRDFKGNADSRIARLLRRIRPEEIQNIIREWGGGSNVTVANRVAESGNLQILQQLYDWNILPN